MSDERRAVAQESIWRQHPPVELLNQMSAGCAVSHLGIQFIELGEDFIRATMPVDERTRQPFGLLHGGASVLLAESLGSVAAQLVAPPGARCVGLAINANHLAGVREGLVEAIARPVHLGRSTQVWEIKISDEAGRLACISRLTMSVLPPPPRQEGARS